MTDNSEDSATESSQAIALIVVLISLAIGAVILGFGFIP